MEQSNEILSMGKKIKKQSIEAFFKETFSQTIMLLGEEHVHFCGKKMYIVVEKTIIISVEFAGTDIAFNNLVLTAMTHNGPIDQNIIPFKFIFKESKAKTGQEKSVNARMIVNATGEYTTIWSGDVSQGDITNINQVLMNYIDAFTSIT